MHLESTFQSVRGKLKNNDNLPLIPANSITNTFRAEFSNKDSWVKNGYSFITLNSVFNQDRISTFEDATDGYTLLSIGLGGTVSLLRTPLNVRITGNNLLNKEYFSHLSRLKYDGIANIGRNISFGISAPF